MRDTKHGKPTVRVRPLTEGRKRYYGGEKSGKDIKLPDLKIHMPTFIPVVYEHIVEWKPSKLFSQKKCCFCGVRHGSVEYVIIGKHSDNPDYACVLCAKLHGVIPTKNVIVEKTNDVV